MQVGATFVAHRQAPKPGQPGEGALGHPTVTAEVGAALDAPRCDAGLDAAGAALAAAPSVVVALVGVQLVRAVTRPPTLPGPHAGHGVQCGCQHAAVVAVGAAQCDAKQRALGIGNKVTLRARPAAVGRVGADLRPLFSQPGSRCPAPHASLGRLRHAGVPATPGAAAPTPRPRATRQACASTSCRNSPARQAPRATGCPSAARTGCQPRRHDPTPAAVHLGLRLPRRQQRLDHRPQVVKKGHAPPTPKSRFCPRLQVSIRDHIEG